MHSTCTFLAAFQELTLVNCRTVVTIEPTGEYRVVPSNSV